LQQGFKTLFFGFIPKRADHIFKKPSPLNQAAVTHIYFAKLVPQPMAKHLYSFMS
jgi:hypothetical protein